MNTQEQLHKLQLPSDFLLDNYKTLQRRNDFEDMIEDLDDLQHEAMSLAFQDGHNQGELNILRQLAEGLVTQEDALNIISVK